jgi:hypothetical protein
MKLINYTLEEIMNSPLPPVYIQRRLPYRPSKSDVRYVYEQLNWLIFDDKLRMPKLVLASHCKKYWGMCIAETSINYTGSYCTIKLMDKWFCPQWMVTTLAHEMCHQYQWDIDGPKRFKKGKDFILSHGPSFFIFRDKLANYGISLKTSHGQRRWFKHQDLFKC